VTDRYDLTQLVRASATDSLPADYVELTARRLGIVSAVTGVVYLVYLVLYATVWTAAASTVGWLASLAGFVVSLCVAAYLFAGRRAAAPVAKLAIGYQWFLCFVLGISESWTVSYEAPSAQVAWSAVVIALFPFLIPASARVILLSSLAAAATTPLAMALVFGASGRSWPEGQVTASYLLPPFLCALLAWAPTSALQRLNAAVQQARRLGNYELEGRLGQGGMGEVWRGRHRLLARPAAVKLIRPEMLGAKDERSQQLLIRRFEREAQATATLDSPHTVELYDFGVSADGILFYVMELLHGLDVETLVQRFGPLPSERAVYLLLQACDSLHDAHRRELIHRDIKPANLFLAQKGGTCDFLKVLDFGLVKRWRTGDRSDLGDSLQSLVQSQTQQTAIGQIVGTPAFLAPEAALGEQAVDARADIYGLGCVAYWMLTGTLVFHEPTPFAMAVAHVTKEPVPPSQRVSHPIDSELEALVMKCLHKDRQRRPGSALALAEALSAIRLSEPWTRERASQWWRRHLPEDGTAELAPDQVSVAAK
jgi:eukaryotic-like serine/threonine-protein kinase